MKKKLFILLILIITASVLSGCISIKKTPAADGGIFKTEDFGETWTQKVFVSRTKNGVNTIGKVGTNTLFFDPKDKKIIYLCTIGNGIYKTDNNGENWQPTSLNSGTYGSVSIDKKSSNIIYVARGNTIIKTIDSMQTWRTIYVETRPKESIISVAVNPFEDNIIYADTKTSILKSYDYGNTWEAIKWMQENPLYIFMSEKNKNVMYFVNYGLAVYRSSDGGINLEDITKNLKEEKFKNQPLIINTFLFFPNTELIYLATNYGIYKTEDNGGSWQEIKTLIPSGSISIATVAINPNDQNQIIFPVGKIIYKTTDGGKTWKTIESLQTSRSINFLLVNPENPNIVYAGTTPPPK